VPWSAQGDRGTHARREAFSQSVARLQQASGFANLSRFAPQVENRIVWGDTRNLRARGSHSQGKKTSMRIRVASLYDSFRRRRGGRANHHLRLTALAEGSNECVDRGHAVTQRCARRQDSLVLKPRLRSAPALESGKCAGLVAGPDTGLRTS
jgi:hypothetical protein